MGLRESVSCTVLRGETIICLPEMGRARGGVESSGHVSGLRWDAAGSGCGGAGMGRGGEGVEFVSIPPLHVIGWDMFEGIGCTGRGRSAASRSRALDVASV